MFLWLSPISTNLMHSSNSLSKILHMVSEVRSERWNIKREHLRTLFTQIKTNTKTISTYGVLGCCVLLKNQNLVSNGMGQAIVRPQISTNDACSKNSISLSQILYIEYNKVHRYLWILTVFFNTVNIKYCTHNAWFQPRISGVSAIAIDQQYAFQQGLDVDSLFIGNYGKQCDQKKSPNVYKTCPKMILLVK